MSKNKLKQHKMGWWQITQCGVMKNELAILVLVLSPPKSPGTAPLRVGGPGGRCVSCRHHSRGRGCPSHGGSPGSQSPHSTGWTWQRDRGKWAMYHVSLTRFFASGLPIIWRTPFLSLPSSLLLAVWKGFIHSLGEPGNEGIIWPPISRAAIQARSLTREGVWQQG